MKKELAVFLNPVISWLILAKVIRDQERTFPKGKDTIRRILSEKRPLFCRAESENMSEPQQGFLQRRPLRRALANWLERHQHPFNRGIHFLGIPLALVGVVLFCWLPWHEWYWGVLAFVA